MATLEWMLRNFLYIVFFLSSNMVTALNPIVQDIYTTDPAPLVFGDRLYVFTGHDEDGSTDFDMRDWRLISTSDLANWQHHGVMLTLDTFSWADERAWAPQVIERNGRFYFYAAIRNAATKGMAIAVGISDDIAGPYVDALGQPLLEDGGIDPTVYIDEDGQVYLFWGNPKLAFVKLNEDMLSFSGDIDYIDLTVDGFGERPEPNELRPTAYEEGPWFYKRNGTYYMMYAANCCTEDLRYSTASHPVGPWKYGGVVMAAGGGAFTNHGGIIDFRGQSYLFYHNGLLPGGGGFTRSVAVESFSYNSDGSIPLIERSIQGPAQIHDLDPYSLQEAETFAWAEGIETEICSEGGLNVAYIDNGDFIRVNGVGFGAGPISFLARVASATVGGRIELRLGSRDGSVIGECDVPMTGGWQEWVTVECPVADANGTQDFYLVFRGEEGKWLFNINWWQFK